MGERPCKARAASISSFLASANPSAGTEVAPPFPASHRRDKVRTCPPQLSELPVRGVHLLVKCAEPLDADFSCED